MIKRPLITDAVEFLYESNMIENEPSGIALLDSVFAWDYLLDQKKITPKVILATHALLMANLNPRIAGQIRTVPVYIGGREGRPVYQLMPLLDGLTQVKPRTEDDIKKWHVQFEEIHPFEDGNGRTGRLLMNYQRVKAGLEILTIHHGAEQFEYYKWFR